MPTYRVIVERITKEKLDQIFVEADSFREASLKAHAMADELDAEGWHKYSNKIVERPRVTHIYKKSD